MDLGTTYSCVGVYHAGSGTVEILADREGHRTIPSVVAFTENGSTLVGVPAKKQAALNPRNTIYEAKRFIGKPAAIMTRDLVERFPFEISRSTSGPKFLVSVAAGKRAVSPEEIGGLVVGELRRTAELRLDSSVKQAVMSVPVEFTAAQRDATVRAASFAGLKVLRILSEPTAAAMAYGLHNKEQVDYIVVFDFGGGTLDVSLLGVSGGMFTTYAIAGNKHLGGEDFSHRFYQHALAIYEERYGVTLNDARAQQRLRTAVEVGKLELSIRSTTKISIEVDDLNGMDGEQTFSFTMTRNDFETLAVDLFEKVLAPLKRVLSEADLQKEQVDEVVLVGGSTRIPRVRELLTDFFGKPPCSSIDPDEAVAVGVAMQAGILAGAWPLQVSALEIPFELRKIEMD